MRTIRKISGAYWERAPHLLPEPTYVTCPVCNGEGSGLVLGEHAICPVCNGEGEVQEGDDYSHKTNYFDS